MNDYSYTRLAIGAPARLAKLRAKAIAHNAKPYIADKTATWRDVRFATLKSHTGLSAGFNGIGRQVVPVWSAMDMDGTMFRSERDCDEVNRNLHQGWYTDADCGDTAIGIVAGLPHGRFLAGYRLTMNDERVYFADIFDNEKETAQMADEHARIIAEREREHAEHYQAALDLQYNIKTWQESVGRNFELRHSKRYGADARDQIAQDIEHIRDARATLAADFADVEF